MSEIEKDRKYTKEGDSYIITTTQTGDAKEGDQNFGKFEATTRNIQLNVSFVMSYRFRNSPILQESYVPEFVDLKFNLRFYDLQTSSTEYNENLRAEIRWNNQTQMP